LPAWYAQFGFIVQLSDGVDRAGWGLSTYATFHMDLSPAASSSLS